MRMRISASPIWVRGDSEGGVSALYRRNNQAGELSFPTVPCRQLRARHQTCIRLNWNSIVSALAAPAVVREL
jgi:hypothetical protein